MKISRKKFEHDFVDLPELSAEIVEGIGRIYTTPEGKRYPSITTVLGAASDMSWLEEWKSRVGEEQVRKVSAQAARRGTAVHELAEEYIRNNPKYTKGHMPANIATFAQIRPILDENLSTVHGLEVPLYSDKLRVAGRVDCLGIWKNQLTIIDFKTSKKVKKREDISNYFIQASAYGFMTFERTGMLPKKIAIIMMVDGDDPLVFEENTRDWIEKFIEMRESVDL